MLLPLLLALQMPPPDTILVPGVVLLGEEIDQPTYVREVAVPRSPFAMLAATPPPPSNSPGMPVHVLVGPGDVGFSEGELAWAQRTIEHELWRGAFPGAALAVGRWDQVVLERGLGTLDRGLGSLRVDPDNTIYDLASLTKVVATTAAVMLLVEDGLLNLDLPVAAYLPDFLGEDKEKVTVRHLLTHTSGLPPGANLSASSREGAIRRAASTPLRWLPGEQVVYSDIGFIILWAVAEAAAAEPLDGLLQRRIYGPLGMTSTGFNPGPACLRCAPTADREGFRGIVHDPLARQLDGIAGNAGLFSSVHDLSRFAAMLANGGSLEGVKIFDTTTIRTFTTRQINSDTRALGWDTPATDGGGAGGLRISADAFGHTGFTGTSLWVDPVRGTWTVLLANRTFRPEGPNRMQALRREINDRVAAAIDQ